MPKSLGHGSLTHRAGGTVASSMTMCPFLSRAFVKKRHIVTFASSTAGQESCAKGVPPLPVTRQSVPVLRSMAA